MPNTSSYKFKEREFSRYVKGQIAVLMRLFMVLEPRLGQAFKSAVEVQVGPLVEKAAFVDI